MQDREKLVPNIHSNPARSQFDRNKSCTRAESGGIEPDCLQHVYNTASIFDHFTILKENYVSVLNCAIIWYHLMTEFDFKIGSSEREMTSGASVEVWVLPERDFSADREETNNIK